MELEFSTLVGRFIHYCGALELLTNKAIKSFSSDAILAAEATKSPLAIRINVLRNLLRDRSDLNEGDIDSLCKELHKLREKRNAVAHNPIVSQDPSGSASDAILMVRHTPEGVEVGELMSHSELASLVERTSKLLIRFAKLIPSAAKITYG